MHHKIKEQDLQRYKDIMYNRLQEFKEEWNELRHLSVPAENEVEQNITIIKREVIDLADRFDIL